MIGPQPEELEALTRIHQSDHAASICGHGHGERIARHVLEAQPPELTFYVGRGVLRPLVSGHTRGVRRECFEVMAQACGGDIGRRIGLGAAIRRGCDSRLQVEGGRDPL